MHNDTRTYEVPADRLIFNHKGLGAGRELGEASVSCNIWGKPSVHILHGEQRPGTAWPSWLLAIAAVLGIAIGTAWYLHAWPFSSPPAATASQDAEAPATPDPEADVPMAQPAEPETTPGPDTAVPAPSATTATQPSPPPAPQHVKTAAEHPAPANHPAPTHTAKARVAASHHKAPVAAKPVSTTTRQAADPAPVPSAASPSASSKATPDKPSTAKPAPSQAAPATSSGTAVQK